MLRLPGQSRAPVWAQEPQHYQSWKGLRAALPQKKERDIHGTVRAWKAEVAVFICGSRDSLPHQRFQSQLSFASMYSTVKCIRGRKVWLRGGSRVLGMSSSGLPGLSEPPGPLLFCCGSGRRLPHSKRAQFRLSRMPLHNPLILPHPA
jgi:hypothetical protein